MLAQDTVRVRTADSLWAVTSLRRKAADTISTTDRLLKVSKDQHVELRPLSLCGVTSLQPMGTRVVFTRDSIDWAPAQSITELVARVPGVFTEKSDWLGTPELVNYFLARCSVGGIRPRLRAVPCQWGRIQSALPRRFHSASSIAWKSSGLLG